MDMLKADSLREVLLPELARAVRDASPRVLARWEDAVKLALPCADELTRAQLRDDIPPLLSQLANVLQTDVAPVHEHLQRYALAHGEVRFHQSYNLAELLIEADLLRRVLFEEVVLELGQPLSTQEIVALNMGVDASVERSVIAFVNHQTEQNRAINEAQSKYLSFLSHDLRGGLNGVLLMLEVLRRQMRDHVEFGESVEDIETIKRSILETVATMDRFLHAERFRKGKVPVKPSMINIGDIVAELLNQFSYSAKDKRIDLRSTTSGACTLYSDQALINLTLQR